jgi:hypothetical protein
MLEQQFDNSKTFKFRNNKMGLEIPDPIRTRSGIRMGQKCSPHAEHSAGTEEDQYFLRQSIF